MTKRIPRLHNCQTKGAHTLLQLASRLPGPKQTSKNVNRKNLIRKISTSVVSWKTKIVKSKQQFPVSKKTTCVFWPFSNPCVNYKGTRRLCTQDHWESEVFRRKHQQCVFVVFSVNELTYFLDWTRSQSILQNFSKNENGIFLSRFRLFWPLIGFQVRQGQIWPIFLFSYRTPELFSNHQQKL